MKWLIQLIINLTCRKNLWFKWKADVRFTSFTVDHLCLSIKSKSKALYFWSSNYLTMTETQTYAESLVWHTPSVCWTNSKLDICYFHDHQDCCTKCYTKATMDRIVDDGRSRFLVVKCSLEIIHFKLTTIKIIDLQTLLSIY